jgi:hypothetical protein
VGLAQGAHASITDAEPDARAPHHDTFVPIRATQDIPPALRRAVLVRDQHCCRVPGCKNTAFLDLHHIELRSEGGCNVIWNFLTRGLCPNPAYLPTLTAPHPGTPDPTEWLSWVP